MDFGKSFEKVNQLKESIETEIDKINNLYEKIFSEITESFKLKHENLIKQENEMKEELQNKVTQAKEKLENFLSESYDVIRDCETINKGFKFWEKEKEKNIMKANIIRTLSYIAKINSNLKYSNSLLVTLMKNLDVKFQEKPTTIKYEEYFFNGIQSTKNIGIIF